MKKTIWLFLLLLIPAKAQAQTGVRIGDDRPVNTQNYSAGVMFPVRKPTIAVCNYPANAIPCTNKATTYTDNTLGIACPTSTQVVLANTNSCVATADQNGNWGAWVAQGTYSYTVTLPTGFSYAGIITAGGTGGGGGGGSSAPPAGAVQISDGAGNFDAAPVTSSTNVGFNSTSLSIGGGTLTGNLSVGQGLSGTPSVTIQQSKSLSSNLVNITAATNGAASSWNLALPINGGVNGNTLHTDGSGNTTWAMVNLSSQVTGNLGVSNLNGGASASSATFWRGDGTWATPTGSGTINGAVQFSFPYYSTSGTANTLSGSAGPSDSQLYLCAQNGATNPPNCTNLPGIVGTTQTTTYPFVTGDRGTYVKANDASPVTFTLGSAGSSGFNGNWYVGNPNIGAGTETLASASTINGATLVPQGWFADIHTPDNTTWQVYTWPTALAFPDCHSASNALIFTAATSVIGCNSISGGGGGGIGTIFTWASTGAAGIGFTTTYEVCIGSSPSTAGNCYNSSGNIAGVESYMPVACTAANLTVVTSNTNGGTPVPITLYKNGVATSEVVTVAGSATAGMYQDTTHTVSLVAGDGISYHVVGYGGVMGIQSIAIQCH